MTSLLIGINAKYIHPNLAIRLLKANTSYSTKIIEFNIKNTVAEIVDQLLRESVDVYAFSCYIWNINLIEEILKEIKKTGKTIVLGGPEVSYRAAYFLENNLADYVIKNEGEESFHALLSYLDGKTSIHHVPNLYHKEGYTFDKYVDLNTSKMAYDLLDDLEHQIVYIETSRGCPYHCSYCMASLDNKVRFFSIEEIKRQLLILIEKKAKTFKFLDRTFNANKKNFLELVDCIILHHQEGQSFQFEITGDLLDDDVITYINTHAPRHLFRFEIGIQSTNLKANLAVHRIQNNEKLFHNIRLIQDADVIDLHLDLIAGLPHENLLSFQNTFNEVVLLKPKELQLGFLKLLHGTRLHCEAKALGYVWQEHAPYEILYNQDLSLEDISQIHITEKAFDYFYNAEAFKSSKKTIIDCVDNPYLFYYELGKKLEQTTIKSLEQRFELLDESLKENQNYELIHEALILDFLSYYKIKPKIWWENRISAKEKKEMIRKIKDNNLVEEDLNVLYKYSILTILSNTIILAIYHPKGKKIYHWNKKTF